MARKSRKQNIQLEQTIFEKPIYQIGSYSRLSVEDLRKKNSDSIGTQQHLIESYVAKQDDMVLVDSYSDINYTGTNFNRPGFERMIADLKSGRINCVVVKDLSRFGRNYLETGNYIEKVFPFMNVRFISVNDEFDTLTADRDGSGYAVPLKNLMNEVYAKDISKKVQSTYATKRRNGEFCGAFAPYGYTKVGDALVVDEEVSDNVRLIFQLVIDGKSDIAIANHLNEIGIPSPSRYRFEQGVVKDDKFANTAHWYKSAVKRITENPVYTGILRCGKHRSAFLQGGSRVEMDDMNCEIHENAHTAIIDKEAFNAVQKIREERNQRYHAKPKEEASENLFKGLIFCGDCGCAMMRHKGYYRYTYLCNIYEQVDKSACSKKYLREEDLITAVYEAVKNQISLAVSVDEIIKRLNQSHTVLFNKNAEEQLIANTQHKLNKKVFFQSALYGDFVDGVINKEDYLRMKSEYEDEIKALRERLADLKSNQNHTESTCTSENKWIAAFRRFEQKKQLTVEMINALISRIEVCEHDRVTITMKYRDEFMAAEAFISSYAEVAV